MRPLGIYRPGNIIQPSDYVNTIAVTTSAQAFDMPSGAAFVAFGPTVNVAVAFGSTSATFPSSTVVDGTASEINPTMRGFGSTKSCTGFSIAGASAGFCSLAFYGPGG